MSESHECAYALAFRAVELSAAARNIDLRRLNHRYRAQTAARLLRSEAARLLRAARQIDSATVRKVWARHKPQIAD